MKISIGQNRVATDALDIGYDANGNRRHVLHWLPIYNAIAAHTLVTHDALSPRPYEIALDAMRAIGGKKYHNKKYGGGIAFTLDRSELESAVNEAIDTYSRWYNSENISSNELRKAADAVVCRLPIVVKSTNYGYVAKGEYSNKLELKVQATYDHTLNLTENPLYAALLWAKKAEYKRWQLNGQESKINVLPTYTALDANTRVYLYSIEGF
mgnify:CR=1 FL=1